MLKRIKRLVTEVLDEVLGLKDRCVHHTPTGKPCSRCEELKIVPFGGQGP